MGRVGAATAGQLAFLPCSALGQSLGYLMAGRLCCCRKLFQVSAFVPRN
jgi:hypothetical protein